MPLFGRDNDPERSPEPEPMGNEDSAVLPEEGETVTAPSFHVGDQGDELFASPAVGEVATPEAEAATVGLYGKFSVERNDGRDRPGGDKSDAKYFVLDYVNDPYARHALRTYIDALKADGAEPELAADLNNELGRTRRLHMSKRK